MPIIQHICPICGDKYHESKEGEYLICHLCKQHAGCRECDQSFVYRPEVLKQRFTLCLDCIPKRRIRTITYSLNPNYDNDVKELEMKLSQLNLKVL